MVDQIQTFDGACVTKDGVVPSGTDATCCCDDAASTTATCGGCHLSGSGTNIPAEVTVTISGFADDSCTGCSVLNGTYVIPYTGGTTYCNYDHTFSPGVTSCSVDYIRLQLRFMNSVNADLFLDIFDLGTATSMQWQYQFGASQDCLTWSQQTLTYFGYSGSKCDTSGVTVTVKRS